MFDLGAHLRAEYGLISARLTRLDAGVFRVHRRDGDDWVARVFTRPRERADVEHDAHVLRSLAAAEFPAERLASDEPVSSEGDHTVLVTNFVDGPRATGARTYTVLGALLGALHTRPGDPRHPGGAWHHLAPRGTPAAEIAAARTRLEAARRDASAAGGPVEAIDQLLGLVAAADPCLDLPHCFVHPDFVPANAIRAGAQPDARTVLVDWTNAGRGPRLWSIGFLLWAGGARDERLVDAILSRYRQRIDLAAEELDRLPAVLTARPLMLDCWSVSEGRLAAPTALDQALARPAVAQRIAARTRAVLAS